MSHRTTLMAGILPSIMMIGVSALPHDTNDAPRPSPFEQIHSPGSDEGSRGWGMHGDYDSDGWVDLDDYTFWPLCMTGPSRPPDSFDCWAFNLQWDGDVDLADFAWFQLLFGRCIHNDACDDGLFCTGQEWCDIFDTGTCRPGSYPCTPVEVCDEFDNVCITGDLCGNGVLGPDEECDDGNRIDGDGCDSNCTVTECGNGIVTSGEECDDGNTTSGDGCDENCLSEGPGPRNDYCASPIAIEDGEFPFDTTGATTDGAEEPTCGFLWDDRQVNSDIWFCYMASCDGEVVASLCGSKYDTKMAVYEGCGCPTDSPITCSDDDCGLDIASRVTFQAQAGASYMIRVGGYLEEQGLGTLRMRCGVDPCGAGEGDCYASHDGIGCEDQACCESTCEMDPYCCDAVWDQYCADEAAGLCTGSFPACEAGAGSCASGNDTPGCEDVECCNLVCLEVPFCCIGTWNNPCADMAFVPCRMACGSVDAGGCFTPNPTPGCDDVDCCKAVCDIDDFCCDITWDSACAEIAQNEAAAQCRG